MNKVVVTVQIKFENDVVLARQRAKQLGALLGLDGQDQTRLATAVSEIARNAFRYAGGGRIEFGVVESERTLVARVVDSGPGIPHLPVILSGGYTSKTGMGLGMIGSRRLVDRFEVESTPGTGTVVTLGKVLPQGDPITPQQLAEVARKLAAQVPRSPFDEMQQQNQELLQALEDLRVRQAQVEELNQQLRETNRGIRALHGELEEKSESLGRASDLKTKFLSQMTHELRTPLNSVVLLSRMLIEQADGPLHEEQLKQATFIRKSSESLLELVNDLLDLARIEAGKSVMRFTEFSVSNLFAALRGMFRPLVDQQPGITLDFEVPPSLPLMNTDEGKVAQILRNLISNAIKFTGQGSIVVRATLALDGVMAYSVIDSGPGISGEDQLRLFQDFTQLDSPAKKGLKGTGLGLSLSRQLADLLGGTLSVVSVLGEGSTFTLRIPVVHPSVERSTTGIASKASEP